MGATVVEKIARAHMVEGPDRPLRAGDMVVLRPRHVLTHDNTAPVMKKFQSIGVDRVADPRQPVVVLDHDIQNRSPENVEKYTRIRTFCRDHGIDFHPAGTGIGHQIMVERGYAQPGWLVVASDSHANTYGAVGALGTPVVRTDAAAIWATGQFWWSIPRTVQVVLEDPEGRQVASDRRDEVIPGADSFQVDQVFQVTDAQVWDINSPRLYTARTTVSQAKHVLDSMDTPFGIRTFTFSADDGFHLNSQRVQLYGVNLHHDQGPLGAAFSVRAMERQLQIMQEMGVNALRTSHNPPAAEVLDLCDRMGIVVWDEAFDKWDRTAGRHDGEPPLEAFAERHIKSLVLRDRNHPCVVVWSIGNEISNAPYDREGKSPERVQFMTGFFHKYDPSRPVGMACHIPDTVDEPILDALNLTGWNYARRYARARQVYPDKPILYSESASTLSTRGYYDPNLPNRKNDYSTQCRVSSYDLNAADWSDIPDAEFKLMAEDRFVAGEFVWTGFDYLGEPTPFQREARSSYFGIVDLCGIPKDRFYLYRSLWRPEETTVHILPHWNWPGRQGKNVPVFVYTNGDAAELFLNGKSLGRREKGRLPERPANLALGKATSASSSQDGHMPANAIDANRVTAWAADAEGADQWWQVDLGQNQAIKYLAIEFEHEEKLYGYDIQVAPDIKMSGQDPNARTMDANMSPVRNAAEPQWRTLLSKPTSRRPQWGGPKRIFHTVDTQARYLRLHVTSVRQNARVAIREFGVYTEPIESDYYNVTYDYRLRWNQVAYIPGELKAVAYRDGDVIGEAVVQTTGAAAKIRLTPDRTDLHADGEDLSYVLVEALDAQDRVVPTADNMIRFAVNGPGEIAGVGNGNPMSYEPFQADHRRLFHGKAMLIVRTLKGQSGRIHIDAKSEGLEQTYAECFAR